MMRPLICLGLCAALTGCAIIERLPSGSEAGGDPQRSAGADTSVDGSPIGGGQGYLGGLTEDEATVIVRTRAQFDAALGSASPGDVIWIPTTVSIDFTGDEKIELPAGITIASSRGRKGAGARLFTTKMATRPLFVVRHGHVRLSGLRLEGPDRERRESASDAPNSAGITVYDGAELLVDGCELFGWSHSAVGTNAAILRTRHCKYHHNRRKGLGYGVLLMGRSEAYVEACVFDEYRHAIAGTGELGQRYEASHNLIMSHAYGHAFDMHGDHESPGTGTEAAGAYIFAHHNTFLDRNHPAVVVRGRPEVQAIVEHNLFAHRRVTGDRGAVEQRNYFGNLTVRDNVCLDPRSWFDGLW